MTVEKTAVIMAGGTGTRFWPLSRRDRPKQLLSIGNHPVMLQATIDRLKKTTATDRILVVTSSDHADLIHDLETDVPEENIIVEPEGRDTAACSGVAAMVVRERFGENAVIGTFPADHRIQPTETFTDDAESAYRASSELDSIITFGVKPGYPSTGYGYILPLDASREIDNRRFLEVEKFTEKPDKKTAMDYIENRDALWNSGMFFWPARLLLEELQQYAPDLHAGIMKIKDRWLETGDLSGSLTEYYADLPEVSVDYAVLENTERCLTLPVDFDWRDLGSWESIDALLDADEDGNITEGDVILSDCQNNVIYEDAQVTVAAVGLEDTVVVATDDAVLVCPKAETQNVKSLVRELKNREREDLL